MKCKGCDRTNNIEYIENTLHPYSSENESWETIASFDCRGWEFTAFHPGNSFGCKGIESGTLFGSPHDQEPIVFDGGDWCGFDEAAD